MHTSIFFFRAASLALLAACSGVTVPDESEVPPPPAAGVAGIYMGLRVNGAGQQYPDYYTFLADGRAFRGTPEEGLNQPLDWAAVCASSECGTYSVSGSQLTFTRQAADPQAFTVGADGVLRKPGSTQGYRRMHVMNDVRPGATYGWLSGADTMMAITLSADGRFRERGTLAWTAWSGPAAPASGEGTYTVVDGTLTLRYDGGPVAHLLLAVPPGVSPAPAPERVYLRTTTIDRLH
ncbi:MAG TPA: hypothetical protein VGB24_23310 [Longimicrobium sp.]|jgi:hypothetical protein|uniref:hypothetical protein n=1 Tax=Longimicrobium sp. TaxID=2029185 RepID=UPI002EDB6A03